MNDPTITWSTYRCGNCGHARDWHRGQGRAPKLPRQSTCAGGDCQCPGYVAEPPAPPPAPETFFTFPSMVLYTYGHEGAGPVGLPFLVVGPFTTDDEGRRFADRYPIMRHGTDGPTIRRWGVISAVSVSKLGESGRWVSAMPEDVSTGQVLVKWPDLPLTDKGGR